MEKRNLMVDSTDPRLIAFERLLNIMDELRDKCPWDQKQTNESLAHLTIEETYELVDAIQKNDPKEIAGELGDLLLHVVFYAKIGQEKGDFDITSVLNQIADKLVYRHPHIYADVQVKDEEEVKSNWEKLKLKEGRKSVLEGVPFSLPAMIKAQRIQEKARGIGFDWEDKSHVKAKVEEELMELEVAIQSEIQTEINAEFGDVLFSMINYARFIGVNPENALALTNQKFINRFQFMETKVKEKNLELNKMSLLEMDELWNEAKRFF